MATASQREAAGEAPARRAERRQEDERCDELGGREAERRAVGEGHDRLERDQRGVGADTAASVPPGARAAASHSDASLRG